MRQPLQTMDLPKNRNQNAFKKETSDKCWKWAARINIEKNGDCIGRAPSKEFES